MRNKASYKSHPIHPILIVFPSAFLSGCVILDSISIFAEKETLWEVGKILAIMGIIGGLIAAIPGIIDFVYTIPPDSSARKRAIKHALLNVSSLVLFSLAIVIRQNELSSRFVVLGIEVVGFVLLLIAAWHGGTLVYRNQIGVDIRYAGAGKWKEERLTNEGKPIVVAKKDELEENQMKLIHVGDKRIVIGKTVTGYVAFDDHCTHRGGSLAGGTMICETVQCPWHGSQFDVRTGNLKSGPAQENIKVYKLSEDDYSVFLHLQLFR